MYERSFAGLATLPFCFFALLLKTERVCVAATPEQGFNQRFSEKAEYCCALRKKNNKKKKILQVHFWLLHSLLLT